MSPGTKFTLVPSYFVLSWPPPCPPPPSKNSRDSCGSKQGVTLAMGLRCHALDSLSHGGI